MTSNSDVTFENVRRMSNSQISRLTKEQLNVALKDAIEKTNQADELSISSNSIKEILREAVMEMKKELRKENEDMLKTITQNLQYELNSLRTEISNMKRFMDEEKSEVCDSIENELEDRHRRRLGLVVVGVKESDSETPALARAHDEHMIEDILKHIKVEEPVSELKIRRIGRTSPRASRLLLVQCKDENVKSSILRNRTLLKSFPTKVFINNDLTKKQQEQRKKLRTELERRKAKGENVYIRNDRILHERKE